MDQSYRITIDEMHVHLQISDKMVMQMQAGRTYAMTFPDGMMITLTNSVAKDANEQSKKSVAEACEVRGHDVFPVGRPFNVYLQTLVPGEVSKWNCATISYKARQTGEPLVRYVASSCISPMLLWNCPQDSWHFFTDSGKMARCPNPRQFEEKPDPSDGYDYDMYRE